jgi:hypothetical protein
MKGICMMTHIDRYAQLEQLSEVQFRRLVGVKRSVFSTLLAIYEEEDKKRKKLPGRPARLSRANHLLMMLEYYRDYCTFLRLGQVYGVSESYAFKILRRVESLLIDSGKITLPKRSDLLQTPLDDILIVDASETPIERPQKNSVRGIQAKRSTIT